MVINDSVTRTHTSPRKYFTQKMVTQPLTEEPRTLLTTSLLLGYRVSQKV